MSIARSSADARSDGPASGEQPGDGPIHVGAGRLATSASNPSSVTSVGREDPVGSDAPGPSAGLTVADVMITRPKSLRSDASLGEVRAVFEDDHVVMVLLTEDGVLRGALLRGDLPDDAAPSAPARPFSSTTGRTVDPAESADAVFRWLLERGRRRLAVVDAGGRLLGLVCLKRRRTGFCSDAGVAARVRARAGTTASDQRRDHGPVTAPSWLSATSSIA